MLKLKDKISSLPKSPGVYEFRDKYGKILYIGKATSLKDRVGSYFRGISDEDSTFVKTKVESSSSHLGRPNIEPMVAQIADIRIHKTDSVLEALILESSLIKKHQPKYNIDGKDDKSFVYAVITREDFPRILILRETELKKVQISKYHQSLTFPFLERNSRNFSKLSFYKRIFGPYISKRQLEIALKIIRKIFPYHSAKQATRQCCFEHQIGLCPGPYASAISRKDYLKNIRGVEMILQGKKKKLLTELQKQMEEYSQKNEFEKAAEMRNRIFALKHIQDVALISDEDSTLVRTKVEPLRIEAYDISNIGGDYSVGSMVVFTNGKTDKSQYRKFKIKTVDGIDDVGMMREVLRRRFRNNWPLPDLIFVDGGKGHLNMAQSVIREFGHDIPIIAVAKGPIRKKLNVYYSYNSKETLVFRDIVNDKKLIERIRDEAHRFAISYHKKLRTRDWKRK